jgi:hypothetical protein
MKVALLQFAPEVGKVQDNIRRADDILQDTRIPADIDWIILPEMAFSGKWQSRKATRLFSSSPGYSEDIRLMLARVTRPPCVDGWDHDRCTRRWNDTDCRLFQLVNRDGDGFAHFQVVSGYG